MMMDTIRSHESEERNCEKQLQHFYFPDAQLSWTIDPIGAFQSKSSAFVDDVDTFSLVRLEFLMGKPTTFFEHASEICEKPWDFPVLLNIFMDKEVLFDSKIS